jgi:hypothetical protein
MLSVSNLKHVDLFILHNETLLLASPLLETTETIKR